jgi:hypothetical protein
MRHFYYPVLGTLMLLNACGPHDSSESKKPQGLSPLSAVSAVEADGIDSSRPIQDRYTVTSAQADEWGNAGGAGHSFYIPRTDGSVLRLIFVSPGDYVEYSDGTAQMSGILADKSDASHQYRVHIDFSDRHDPVPGQAEHQELNTDAYVDNGGPVDPSTWHYYKQLTGRIEGLGDRSNEVIELTGAHIYDFQVGAGASGKNANTGAAVWFYCKVSSGADTLKVASDCQGDLNVSLSYVAPPPPPPPSHDCPEGFIWSDSLEQCVQITPPPPPPPTNYCPAGYHWSSSENKCLEDGTPLYPPEPPPPAPIPTCPVAYHWSSSRNKCVLNPAPIVYPPVYYIAPVVVPVPVYYSPCGCSQYYGY